MHGQTGSVSCTDSGRFFVNTSTVPQKELGMRLLYDAAHNIVKIEEHIVEGKKLPSVHRKGATRGIPAKSP